MVSDVLDIVGEAVSDDQARAKQAGQGFLDALKIKRPDVANQILLDHFAAVRQEEQLCRDAQWTKALLEKAHVAERWTVKGAEQADMFIQVVRQAERGRFVPLLSIIPYQHCASCNQLIEGLQKALRDAGG